MSKKLSLCCLLLLTFLVSGCVTTDHYEGNDFGYLVAAFSTPTPRAFYPNNLGIYARDATTYEEISIISGDFRDLSSDEIESGQQKARLYVLKMKPGKYVANQWTATISEGKDRFTGSGYLPKSIEFAIQAGQVTYVDPILFNVVNDGKRKRIKIKQTGFDHKLKVMAQSMIKEIE